MPPPQFPAGGGRGPGGHADALPGLSHFLAMWAWPCRHQASDGDGLRAGREAVVARGDWVAGAPGGPGASAGAPTRARVGVRAGRSGERPADTRVPARRAGGRRESDAWRPPDQTPELGRRAPGGSRPVPSAPRGPGHGGGGPARAAPNSPLRQRPPVRRRPPARTRLGPPAHEPPPHPTPRRARAGPLRPRRHPSRARRRRPNSPACHPIRPSLPRITRPHPRPPGPPAVAPWPKGSRTAAPHPRAPRRAPRDGPHPVEARCGG